MGCGPPWSQDSPALNLCPSFLFNCGPLKSRGHSFPLHPQYLSITRVINSKFFRQGHRASKIWFTSQILLLSTSSKALWTLSLLKSSQFSKCALFCYTLLPSPLFCSLHSQRSPSKWNFSFKPQLRYLLVFKLIPNFPFPRAKWVIQSSSCPSITASITVWYSYLFIGLSSQRYSEQKIMVSALFPSSAHSC